MNFATTFLEHVGGLFRFLVSLLITLREFYRIPHLVWEQMVAYGVNSLSLVVVTSSFIGMVSAIQTSYQIGDYVPLMFIGAGVSKAVMIELSPVIIALVMSGRSGAGMAAELGTMRVTDQIDALDAMGVDSYRYLATPRVIASVVSLPLLTIVSIFVALSSAILVSRFVLGVEPVTFINGMKLYFKVLDIGAGLLKSLFFGLIVGVMGCYFGYNAEGGAVGVGRATTLAVVVGSVSILIADYLLGVFLFR